MPIAQHCAVCWHYFFAQLWWLRAKKYSDQLLYITAVDKIYALPYIIWTEAKGLNGCCIANTGIGEYGVNNRIFVNMHLLPFLLDSLKIGPSYKFNCLSKNRI